MPAVNQELHDFVNNNLVALGVSIAILVVMVLILVFMIWNNKSVTDATKDKTTFISDNAAALAEVRAFHQLGAVGN